MEKVENGALEVAITYLNIASAKEAQLDPVESEETVRDYIEKSMKIFDEHENRDGYYAFVCEKCAPGFSYYGWFLEAEELEEIAAKEKKENFSASPSGYPYTLSPPK